MGNIFNEDFRDFISALNEADVKYILVGGYSVILHGYSRTTGDMDIWVERSQANYKQIVIAFINFGMPVFDMTEDNFLNHSEWEVFTFGLPPASIDLMIKVKGLEFRECFDQALYFEESGIKIRTIHINNLLQAKRASGRPKDLDDLKNLKEL